MLTFPTNLSRRLEGQQFPIGRRVDAMRFDAKDAVLVSANSTTVQEDLPVIKHGNGKYTIL